MANDAHSYSWWEFYIYYGSEWAQSMWEAAPPPRVAEASGGAAAAAEAPPGASGCAHQPAADSGAFQPAVECSTTGDGMQYHPLHAVPWNRDAYMFEEFYECHGDAADTVWAMFLPPPRSDAASSGLASQVAASTGGASQPVEVSPLQETETENEKKSVRKKRLER